MSDAVPACGDAPAALAVLEHDESVRALLAAYPSVVGELRARPGDLGGFLRRLREPDVLALPRDLGGFVRRLREPDIRAAGLTLHLSYPAGAVVPPERLRSLVLAVRTAAELTGRLQLSANAPPD